MRFVALAVVADRGHPKEGNVRRIRNRGRRQGGRLYASRRHCRTQSKATETVT